MKDPKKENLKIKKSKKPSLPTPKVVTSASANPKTIEVSPAVGNEQAP